MKWRKQKAGIRIWIPAFGMLGRKEIEGLENEKTKKA